MSGFAGFCGDSEFLLLRSSRVSKLLRCLLWGPSCGESSLEVRGSWRLLSFSTPLAVLLGDAAALLQRHKLLYWRDRRTARLHRATQEGT